MYYLFDDSGALINEFESVSEGLSQKNMFPNSILLYYGEGAKDAWEHGIEIETPEAPDHYFSYELTYGHGGVLQDRTETLEQAIEHIRYEIDHKGARLTGEIDEITCITHKVKF